MAAPRHEVPLLAGQASIWAAEQFGTVGTPYNFRWVISYPADLVHGPRLVEILEDLVEQHGALHARVVSERGVPRVRFDRPTPVERHRPGSSDPDGAETVEALIAGGSQPFDLAESAGELHVVDGAGLVHVVAIQHHVLVDGMSRALMAADIDAVIEHREPDRVDVYADVHAESYELEQQANMTAGDVVAELVSRGLETEAPSTAAEPSYELHRDAVPGIVDRLRDQVAENGGSVAGAMLAGLTQGLLPCDVWSPVVGLAVSTRPRPETRCVGCFVNTVPVLTGPGPLSLDAATGAARRGPAVHRHVAVDRLVVEARRSGSRFDLRHRPLVSLSTLETVGRAVVHDSPGHRPGPLTARLWLINDDVFTSVEHADSAIEPAAGRELSRRLASYLDEVAQAD